MRRLSAAIRRPHPGVLVLLSSAAGGYYYRRHASLKQEPSGALNRETFTPYTIAAKQPVSSTSTIFTLSNEHAGGDRLAHLWENGVWSVQLKQPQLQIARAYTPLPPTPDTEHADDNFSLRLLIRKEEGGEVSGYLHNLPLHSTVEVRGPNVELEIPENVSEILFLAGGTGIAPAMQVARALAGRQEAKMHILWANRRREECVGGHSDERETSGGWRSWLGLATSEANVSVEDSVGTKGAIVRELEELQKARNSDGKQRLDVRYYVDEENSFIQSKHVVARVREPRKEPTTSSGLRLILVSGPDGFVEYWAGRKVLGKGHEVQGPLGGVLSRLDLKDWHVWKL